MCRLSMTMLLFLVFFYGPALAWAEESGFTTTAKGAVLMEAHHGKVLWQKEPHMRQPIASMVKIMTLLLAVEAVEQGKVKLTDTVTASEYAAGMGGSQIYLAPFEQMSLRELLIAIATGSANDASVAVAEHVAGSAEAFVEAMNSRARELGLKHTHYVNPTGLPAPGQYSCAQDQAALLREALRRPLFRELTRMKEYDLRDGEFKLWNTNKLLWWYKGADAGKTGWTNDAGFCLASSAAREGLRLIAVVLGCPEPKTHFRESIKLYNWGFARFQAVCLAKAGIRVAALPVERGVLDRTDVLTGADVTLVMPRGKDKGFTRRIVLPQRVEAPLVKGQPLGAWVVCREGKEVLKVSLVAARDVPRADFFGMFNKALKQVYGM
ncbi:MAG TPA: D-alanyl-D-alanine carboxypeptidase [Desulfotomaculum sp.]|nr:D-alanyl-D-alanine carboxypeptidase [Desulfotomaculum sp.]